MKKLLRSGQQKRKNKQDALAKVKKNLDSRIKKIYKSLVKLFPKARKSTVFHLTVALVRGYKSFVTDDVELLKHEKILESKFKIRACKTVYDISRYYEDIGKNYYSASRYKL